MTDLQAPNRANSSLISRIEALAGADVAASIRAEFGGSTLYVPRTIAPMPAFCIRGTFSPQAQFASTARAVAVAVDTLLCGDLLLNGSAQGLVVEVETRGIGQGYLEQLQETLAPMGVTVLPLTQPR